MSLGINSISSNNTTIQNTNTDKKTKEAEVSKEKKEEEIIDTYEKGNNTNTGIYSKNKMSETDRAALAEQLKSDMESRKAQLINIINKSIFGQADAFGKALPVFRFGSGACPVWPAPTAAGREKPPRRFV